MAEHPIGIACLKIHACGTQGRRSEFSNLSASAFLWLLGLCSGSQRFWSSLRSSVRWFLHSWSRQGCAKTGYFHSQIQQCPRHADMDSFLETAQAAEYHGTKWHCLWCKYISKQNGGVRTFSAIFSFWVTLNQRILALRLAGLHCAAPAENFSQAWWLN